MLPIYHAVWVTPSVTQVTHFVCCCGLVFLRDPVSTAKHFKWGTCGLLLEEVSGRNLMLLIMKKTSTKEKE